MRSLILKTAIATSIFALSASTAVAQYWTGGGSSISVCLTGISGTYCGSGTAYTPSTVPEIDASSGMLAVVALSAVLLFALERRRQAKALATNNAQ